MARKAPRRSAFSVADRVRSLAASGLTQKQIGKRLGVTDRTVRRWKNGRRPGDDINRPMRAVAPPPAIERKLARLAADSRQKIRRDNRRLAHGSPVPDADVLPRGSRRKLATRDAQGRDTGRKHSSDWTNYSVKGMGRAQIMALLQSLNRQGATVQLLFNAPAVDPYFRGRVTHAQRKAKQKIRGGSDIKILQNDPPEWIERIYRETFGVKGREPLFIAVMDRGAFGKK